MSYRWLVFLNLLMVLPGCSFTSLETARQLEHEEIVVHGSLDNIGYGPIPRAHINVMRGIEGRGDMSFHGGTTLFTLAAGLGGRYYLNDRLNLSLQSDLSTIMIDIGPAPFGSFERFLLAVTPRLTTAVQGREFFYTGIQVTTLSSFGDVTEFTGAAAGLILGMDFPSAFQFEVILFPLVFQNRQFHLFGDWNQPQTLALQFSFGGYVRWEPERVHIDF